jgi:hypothetical protein
VDTLILGVPPLPWYIAGGGIALITLLLLYVSNHSLGISTGFENICQFFSKAPYFLREEIAGPQGRWRLDFIAGLFAGGVLSSLFTPGGWEVTWNMGIWDEKVALGDLGKFLWLFLGGVLIGFGTRMAGGCTSGHGIFGLANWERGSWVSVLSFMVTGIAFTHFIYYFLFP